MRRLCSIRAIVSAAVMVVLLSTALAGQEPQTASLEGRVVAADGDLPLAGALITLPDLDRRTLTDADGRFRFVELPPGTHTVRVEARRGTETRQVELTSGEASEIEVRLTLVAVEGTEVTVLVDRLRLVDGNLAEVPGSAHVLDQRDLEFQNLLFEDAHRVLRQVPGVNVQEEDGFGLRVNVGLRGTGSERSSKITVMEDGVLSAPAPYAAPSAYYFPVVGRMEGIEVRKGSSQIEYGPHTTGGAVNLISASIPRDLRLGGALEGGEFGTAKLEATAGDAGRNFGWLLQTYQMGSDGFKDLDGGGDTGFRLADYVLKLRANTDQDADVYQEVELKAGLTDEVSDETYLGLTEADFRADPLRRYAASQEDVMNADHRQVQLRHFVRPSATIDVTTVVYRNDFSRAWYKLNDVNREGLADVLDEPESFASELAILRGATSEPGALRVRDNNRDYYAQGVQSVLGLRLDGGDVTQELELGARWHRDEEDRFQRDDLWQMLDGRMTLTERGAPGSQDNRVGEARAWSFFAQDRLALGDWTLTPGVRFEDIAFTRTDYATDDPQRSVGPTQVRETHVSALVPGVGVTFAADPALSFFGGVHRGFGPPGPGADDETDPEESVNYELGARVVRDALVAQLVGFVNDYDNILGAATLSTGDTGAGDLFNGGAVDVRGIELSMETDVARGTGLALGLPVRLAYTWTEAEFASSFESAFEPWGTVEEGDELPYLPEHQLFASAGVEADRWSVTATASHTSAMRTVAGSGAIPEGEGTDSVVVLGLAGELALTPWSRLVAGVQNLTDEEYVVARRPAGARPGLPRTLMAGVRFTP